MRQKKGRCPATASATTTALTAVVAFSSHSACSSVVSVVSALKKRIDDHEESRVSVQREAKTACSRLREQAKALEEELSSELENVFSGEINRLQNALDRLSQSERSPECRLEAVRSVKAVIAKKWSCGLLKMGFGASALGTYKLEVIAEEDITAFCCHDSEKKQPRH